MNVRGGIRSTSHGAARALAALLLAGCLAPSALAADEFAISGEIDGLYPGADAILDARVTNPHAFPIRVISTTVAVHDASAACPASLLEIGDLTETVEVPPGGTGTVPLSVHMDRAAPDACQGATWPLEFTGTAVGPATSELPGTSMIDGRSLAAMVAIGTALLVIGLTALGRRGGRRGRAAS